jgi:hypothetical protein
MFATPEAAKWFRRACNDPLTLLEGDLEPFGVRCRNPETTTDESIVVQEAVVEASPEPLVFEHATLLGVSGIVTAAEEEADTAPEPRLDTATVEPIGEPPVRRLGQRIILAAAIVLAVATTWYAFPRTIGARGPDAPNVPAPNVSGTGGGPGSFVATPEKAPPPAEGAASPEKAGEPADAKPAQVPPTEPSQTAPARGRSPGRRSEASPHAHGVQAGRSQYSEPGTLSPKPARRAGNLSADDF